MKKELKETTLERRLAAQRLENLANPDQVQLPVSPKKAVQKTDKRLVAVLSHV